MEKYFVIFNINRSDELLLGLIIVSPTCICYVAVRPSISTLSSFKIHKYVINLNPSFKIEQHKFID